MYMLSTGTVLPWARAIRCDSQDCMVHAVLGVTLGVYKHLGTWEFISKELGGEQWRENSWEESSELRGNSG